MADLEPLKEQAALKALEHVQSGMTLGLGTGSTAKYLIQALGQRLVEGELKDIAAVPTSEATAEMARELGIPLQDLGASGVDVAIDGMDEVTDTLDAIKGLGGALAREKVVAARAERFVLIGDETKRVERLGEKAPVPVEVLPFGWRAAQADLERLGCEAVLRKREGDAVKSDNDNLLIDCHFAEPFSAREVALSMSVIPGVLEHGLFLGLAQFAFIATAEGVTELSL